ncbi:hypothetical protein GDO78_005267 [Eleutherodactylus coqui]|uniref:Aminopeptidase n=1 Tax=Eleutherodactylus coqui TaxID=57060 RepID=A0A8J6FLM9_ELECQ|nr:hypothetical protein GDO78_005267 [Eleutherodactylus coqui]
MAKGFYVSKLVAFVGIFFSIAAVATIIALAVVYSNEKSNNNKAENGEATTTVSTVSTSTALDGPTTPASNELWDRYRLPHHLIPQHYNVDLRPVLTKNENGLYVFNGVSEAYFTCRAATKHVIIHSKNLNYTNPPKLTDEYNTVIDYEKHFFSTKTDFLILELKGELETLKKYILHTEFIGELAADLAGFYRSEYVEDGETKIIATTQMQAADARKAFPCFDEPALKATFNITIRHKPDYVALSNMNPIDVSNETWNAETWQVTKFAQSVKMSTYLVAFIVSQFSPAGNETVKANIWGRKKAIVDEKQGDYALDKTGLILEFLQDYYNYSYPLPKSDQVALPDFSAGAMENWGLVTYRDTALLYDPNESSIGNKERVVTVIAHELAHQWFGNLVTIRWWNDLWLNEGFASYVEYLGADYAEDTWNIKDLAVLNDIHRVMAVDALASSHPLTSKEEDVNTPEDISALFDSITYSKGASVIRMLSSFLTEELFKTGLQAYLKKHAFDNTVYYELWESLQEAYDNEANRVYLPATIGDIMDTWVLQMGFPVVTINTTDGSLTQKHFLLDPTSVVNHTSPYNYTWFVPISFVTNSSVEGHVWLTQETGMNSSFHLTGDNDWLLANINVTGYYRVNYDDRNWDRLLQQLENNHTVIPVINRAQIIDDSFNLARAQIISTTRALQTTRFLSKDKYMKQQVEPLFWHFNTTTNNFKDRPETLTEQYNEINAVSMACSYGIAECEQLVTELFQEWKNTKINKIHPNLRSTIYCNAIAQGGEDEWNFLWEQFNTTTNAQEADKLRAALACSKEPFILNRLLEYSLDPNKIRRQDTLSTITNVANNVVGQNLAWDFIRANWKTLVDNIGGGMSFGNVISGVSRRFNTDFDLQQLQDFKKFNTDNNIGFGTATLTLEQAIEKTRANIVWVKQNKDAVQNWFEGAMGHRDENTHI